MIEGLLHPCVPLLQNLLLSNFYTFLFNSPDSKKAESPRGGFTVGSDVKRRKIGLTAEDLDDVPDAVVKQIVREINEDSPGGPNVSLLDYLVIFFKFEIFLII